MHGIVRNPRKTSIKSYRKMKLRMLRDFCVKLSDEEKNHMESLTREIDIDHFYISMMNKYIKTHI